MISTTLPRVLHFAVNLERYLSPPYCFSTSRFYLEYLSNCRKVTSSIKPPQTRHKREERRGEGQGANVLLLLLLPTRAYDSSKERGEEKFTKDTVIVG